MLAYCFLYFELVCEFRKGFVSETEVIFLLHFLHTFEYVLSLHLVPAMLSVLGSSEM